MIRDALWSCEFDLNFGVPDWYEFRGYMQRGSLGKAGPSSDRVKRNPGEKERKKQT